MLYTPAELPQNGSGHIEELLIWAALCLEHRSAEGATGYGRAEMNNSGVPVPVVATDVIRVQSGPNYGQAVFRLTAHINLENSAIWGSKIYYATQPFDSADQIPTKFAGQ